MAKNHEQKLLNTTIPIVGMHCGSCEILLEQRIKAVPGVVAVEVDHRTGVATITARASALPSSEKIEAAIRNAGYTPVTEDVNTAIITGDRKWMEIGGALLVILALWKLLRTFDLVTLAPATNDALTLGGVLLVGLVAGTSSCLAVTGGLLLSVAAKFNEHTAARSPWERFQPLLHFNIGRLASYFVLGGLTGLLGKTLTLSTEITGYLNIAVAFVMLYLALTILEMIPKGSCPIRPSKALAHWIASFSENKHPAAPFSLGALTYFLPCGFTQSLQLVALASGSFLQGALTMFVFALGTLPSLLGLSALSSTTRGTPARLFLRFSGTLVLILALFNLNAGFALTGVNLAQVFASVVGNRQAAQISVPAAQNGIQEISMRVTPYGYEPQQLAVRAGIPVRWTIDGTLARGCTSVLVIPTLNIVRPLQQGPNIVEFIPEQPGQLAFSCSMGMVRGSIAVL